jgi:heme/copper-type cytochrome/quinol oxidase subunit 4
VLGALLIATGLTVSSRTELLVMHEIWAGTLLTLAFALHKADRWLPTVLLSLLAVLIREMALPFILLMTATALWHRRCRECTVWIAVICIFAAALWLHALHLAPYVHPNDPASQGWNSFGGWTFFVDALWATSPLRVMPHWIGAVFVSLALLGWASWRTSVGAFGFLYLAGYAFMMMIFGRPENFYWSLMVAPLWLLGLLAVPAGITDLWFAITSKPVATTPSANHSLTTLP